MPADERAFAAASRALAREPRLTFRGETAYLDGVRIGHRALGLRPGTGNDLSRGVADGLALRIRHSDADLHSRLRPDEPVARAVFDLLEQFRVEAMLPRRWPGARHNVRLRHKAWTRALAASGVAGSVRGLLLLCVAELARAALSGEPMSDATADLIETPRAWIGPRIGPDLAAARRLVANQEAFARHALTIARAVSELDARMADVENDDADEDFDRARRRAELLAADDTDASSGGTSGSSLHPRFGGGSGYGIYTVAYDRECALTDLVRSSRLAEHRAVLEEYRAMNRVNVRALAARLSTVLSGVARTHWQGGLTEGLVDGARLTRLITSAASHDVFRDREPERRVDAAVSVLVDCSGSMKSHALAIAALLDALTHALDLAGAAVEVLGFTTAGWNGGQARKDWQREGRPHEPGRLTEVLHFVVQEFDTPWRRARVSRAGFLEERLFREGVDGEAVAWAGERLVRRTEQRRILIVLSDGGPSDRSTALVNRPTLLDDHLHLVIGALDHEIELIGLGVGDADLGFFYPRSTRLDLCADSVRADLDHVIAVIAD